MGLDMYLTAENFYNDYFPDDKSTLAVLATLPNLPVDLKIDTISGQVLYWRKANHIHNWFVENVQDGRDECQLSYVNREQMRELLDTCEEVLADHSKAEELLPTRPGFFFGGTEYDEYYFQDLEHTVKGLEKALSPAFDGWDFYYRSSW